MNHWEIIAQIIGALLSGSVVAVTAIVKMGRHINATHVEVGELKRVFAQCQKEREICRASMRSHHEDTDNHVGAPMMTMLTDIQRRLERIETRLMNGHHVN
jgi:hypothetical protein